jgi:hypothetical protein
MNIQPPPVHPRSFGRPPEDIDGLLRAFYRAEMPDPWPTMKAPFRSVATALSPKRNGWSGFGSRFALAATVGLCLVGSLLLAMIFPTGLGSRPTLPEHFAPNPYQEFQTQTEKGQPVQVKERHTGNTTIIKISRIPLPMDEEED